MTGRERELRTAAIEVSARFTMGLTSNRVLKQLLTENGRSIHSEEHSLYIHGGATPGKRCHGRIIAVMRFLRPKSHRDPEMPSVLTARPA
jgi:hypothetical protein